MGNTSRARVDRELRNVRIGHAIEDARRSQERTVSECARAMSIDRGRYRRIEAGTSEITAVELETLAEYLHVSLDRILAYTTPVSNPGKIIVRGQPGEQIPVTIYVDIQAV